jgi:two-component system NarL family response regulator
MLTNTERRSHPRYGGRHSATFGSQDFSSSVNPRIRQILQAGNYAGKTISARTQRRSEFEINEAVPIEAKQATDTSLPLKIMIADDHPVVREGLAALISRRKDMTIVAQASNGSEAVERFFASCPDIALLDLRMPVMDGIDAVASIYEKDPAARLVILTIHQNEEDIYQALQAGAQGYLSKSAPVEELLECIRAVVAGRTWVPPGVGAQLAKRVATRELTRREHDVLHAMAAGKSNKEIGVVLDISEGTVKVHMTHILEKLKAGGRTEAIGVAVKRGLVCLNTSSTA